MTRRKLTRAHAQTHRHTDTHTHTHTHTRKTHAQSLTILQCISHHDNDYLLNTQILSARTPNYKTHAQSLTILHYNNKLQCHATAIKHNPEIKNT